MWGLVLERGLERGLERAQAVEAGVADEVRLLVQVDEPVAEERWRLQDHRIATLTYLAEEERVGAVGIELLESSGGVAQEVANDWLLTRVANDWLLIRVANDWLLIRVANDWLLTRLANDWG